MSLRVALSKSRSYYTQMYAILYVSKMYRCQLSMIDCICVGASVFFWLSSNYRAKMKTFKLASYNHNTTLHICSPLRGHKVNGLFIVHGIVCEKCSNGKKLHIFHNNVQTPLHVLPVSSIRHPLSKRPKLKSVYVQFFLSPSIFIEI